MRLIDIKLFLFLAALCFVGCNKDAHLRLPQVETISAEVAGNDVVITGKIIDDGNSGIYTLGFCYQQDTVPQLITKNQILINKCDENGMFQAIIPDLKQDSTYYFKAFIITETGNAIGEAIEYTVPRFRAPEVPCESNLTEHQIRDKMIDYDNPAEIYTVSAWESKNSAYEYEVTIDCGLWKPEIKLSFFEKPITGVYTLRGHLDSYNRVGNEAAMQIFKNGQIRGITSRLQIYVNHEQEGRIVISFCDLTYGMGSVGFALSGKVVVEE